MIRVVVALLALGLPGAAIADGDRKDTGNPDAPVGVVGFRFEFEQENWRSNDKVAVTPADYEHTVRRLGLGLIAPVATWMTLRATFSSDSAILRDGTGLARSLQAVGFRASATFWLDLGD